MKCFSHIEKRAPLGAALGLAIAIGLLPSSASAVAMYSTSSDILGIVLAVGSGWTVTSEVTADGFVSTIPFGGNAFGSTSRTGGGPGDAAFLQTEGSADAPGGQIGETVFNEISIEVSNVSGVAAEDRLLIGYSLAVAAITSLPGESATGLSFLELFDSSGTSLQRVDVTGGAVAATLSQPVSLPSAGDMTSFLIRLESGGEACSPGTGFACAALVPTPGSLSLLGLSVLVSLFVRVRRRR